MCSRHFKLIHLLENLTHDQQRIYTLQTDLLLNLVVKKWLRIVWCCNAAAVSCSIWRHFACSKSILTTTQYLLTGLQLVWGHSEGHHFLLLFSNLLQPLQAPINGLYSRPKWVKKISDFFNLFYLTNKLVNNELISQVYNI